LGRGKSPVKGVAGWLSPSSFPSLKYSRATRMTTRFSSQSWRTTWGYWSRRRSVGAEEQDWRECGECLSLEF